jgi:hypothetical protein
MFTTDSGTPADTGNFVGLRKRDFLAARLSGPGAYCRPLQTVSGNPLSRFVFRSCAVMLYARGPTGAAI